MTPDVRCCEGPPATRCSKAGRRLLYATRKHFYPLHIRKVKVFPSAGQAPSHTESKFIMYVLRRSLCRRQPCSPCKVCLEFKPDRLSSDNRYDGARSWYQNFCVLFDSWIVCLIFKTRKQSRHALRPVPPKLLLEM